MARHACGCFRRCWSAGALRGSFECCIAVYLIREYFTFHPPLFFVAQTTHGCTSQAVRQSQHSNSTQQDSREAALLSDRDKSGALGYPGRLGGAAQRGCEHHHLPQRVPWPLLVHTCASCTRMPRHRSSTAYRIVASAIISAAACHRRRPGGWATARVDRGRVPARSVPPFMSSLCRTEYMYI